MIYWQNYGGKEGMSTVKKIKVFFDSSVLIAGIASRSRGGISNRLLILCEKEFIIPVISEEAGIASRSRGGVSNRLLILCEKEFIIPVISEEVVTEVIRNIEKNCPGAFLYHKLFKTLPFEFADPTPEFIAQAQKIINILKSAPPVNYWKKFNNLK